MAKHMRKYKELSRQIIIMSEFEKKLIRENSGMKGGRSRHEEV
jgi:hypothetical protein